MDFLRLLAIGYDEICWPEHLDAPANDDRQSAGVYVEPNEPFRDWVTDTFDVAIPATGRDIVKSIASIGDTPPTGDAFCDWVSKVTG
ncbi:MAG: hypothetical protein AAGL69_02845 [Pseudomonadota bacterium]